MLVRVLDKANAANQQQTDPLRRQAITDDSSPADIVEPENQEHNGHDTETRSYASVRECVVGPRDLEEVDGVAALSVTRGTGPVLFTWRGMIARRMSQP